MTEKLKDILIKSILVLVDRARQEGVLDTRFLPQNVSWYN